MSPVDFGSAIHQLPVVKPNHGLHLRALADVTIDGVKRQCGDEWQLKGPVTYIPNPEVVSYLCIQ